MGYSFLPSSQTSYLYRSMRYSGHWQCESKPYGSVFGLEFSPQGNVVISACEKNAILIIDPYTHQCVKAVQEAHTDCVNCVRFLDNRTFLTCSDDTTLAVWDIRNMDEKVSSLVGHNKWVKSIEYSPQEQLLVTTGYDNTVRIWETDNFAEGCVSGRVAFHCHYITRLKLTADGKKMVIGTSVGFMLVIHELRLRRLEEDMAGFQPFQVWISHRGDNYSCIKTKPFTRHQNRVQFISDFLPEMSQWCFNSIQVHPSGTCVLSRFVSEDIKAEWTAVHALDSTADGQLPLLWYTEEPNREKDFIKEICFSEDGRVIVSPFAFG
jgi:WD repeat-containing protein 32